MIEPVQVTVNSLLLLCFGHINFISQNGSQRLDTQLGRRSLYIILSHDSNKSGLLFRQDMAMAMIFITNHHSNNMCIKFLILFYSCSIPLSAHNNIRTEPKHIVFLSKRLLFQFSHTGSKPEVTATQNGTEVVIKTACVNPGCRKDFIRRSQPIMPGTKTAAGNFLVCMATLFSGGSFTKVKQIFRHMGLSCISLNTFFNHQRVSCT